MVDGWKKKCSVPIIRNVSSDRADSSPSIEREGKKNSPFQANSTMVQKPRHPPWRNVVPLSPFSFRLFSPLAWHLESRGDGEKRKKKRKKGRKKKRGIFRCRQPLSSPLPPLCLVPRIITHPRCSPILERWHVVTRRIARELQKSSPFQIETRNTFCIIFLFFSVFLFFFFFFYSLRCNACDILFTGRVASRRKRAVAGVKMH